MTHGVARGEMLPNGKLDSPNPDAIRGYRLIVSGAIFKSVEPDSGFERNHPARSPEAIRRNRLTASGSIFKV